MNGGVVLVNTSLMAAGSNVTTPVTWNGGQGVLVVSATQMAPIITVMMPGVGSGNKTVKMNSGVINADGSFGPYYWPAGSYQVHTATGSSIGLFVGIFPTP